MTGRADAAETQWRGPAWSPCLVVLCVKGECADSTAQGWVPAGGPPKEEEVGEEETRVWMGHCQVPSA